MRSSPHSTGPGKLVVLLALAVGARAAEPVDFRRQIQPILERACVQCHGPEKQKGKLRLDSAEALAKGGENGSPITAGRPEESDFFHRVTLASGHEDVMPPKGKGDHLTAAETEALKQWISEGASWPNGVVAVAMKGTGAAPTGPAATPGELAARMALAKLGVRVRPLAASVNWVRISFRGVQQDLPEEAWTLLRQLANAVEADLSSVKVTDEQLASVEGLPNLTALNLAQTPVTDHGLDHVLKLQKLTTLNLYGTAITDAGLAKLAGLKELSLLYVGASGVTGPGVAALKGALPKLRVEDGSDFAELARPTPVTPPKPEEAAKPAVESAP